MHSDDPEQGMMRSKVQLCAGNRGFPVSKHDLRFQRFPFEIVNANIHGQSSILIATIPESEKYRWPWPSPPIGVTAQVVAWIAAWEVAAEVDVLHSHMTATKNATWVINAKPSWDFDTGTRWVFMTPILLHWSWSPKNRFIGLSPVGRWSIPFYQSSHRIPGQVVAAGQCVTPCQTKMIIYLWDDRFGSKSNKLWRLPMPSRGELNGARSTQINILRARDSLSKFVTTFRFQKFKNSASLPLKPSPN